MNKLSALSKLASAYHDQRNQLNQIVTTESGNLKNACDVLDILAHNFHYIRRSLTLEDLAPQPKAPVEGINPVGPKFF